jgi:hypothetical protein
LKVPSYQTLRSASANLEFAPDSPQSVGISSNAGRRDCTSVEGRNDPEISGGTRTRQAKQFVIAQFMEPLLISGGGGGAASFRGAFRKAGGPSGIGQSANDSFAIRAVMENPTIVNNDSSDLGEHSCVAVLLQGRALTFTVD